MKSKTSFFNVTVLRKDISRFAPVWGLYTIFQVLFVLLMWGDEGEPARFAANAAGILMGMGVLNLLYGGLCAFLLFGDLFKPRMCNMLHAFPMRREGWFLTHLCAGFLFCFGPNLVGALFASLLLRQYAYAAFIWLAVMVLEYLFFFAVGVFAVMCAGNLLGALAVYGLFNFFAVLAAWLIATFYQPVLYGVVLDLEQYLNLSPTIFLTQAEFVDFAYDNMNASTVFHGFVPHDWYYLFTAAAVGVLLLGAALLIYRRRELESAGDLIALRPVAPIFLVLYTLCAGAILYFVADIFSDGMQYVFLLIGFAIGFFTGLMLLEKRVRVFRMKRLLQFGLFVGVFVVSIVLTLADPIGITRYVPKADQVAQVRISPYSSHHYLNRNTCSVEDPAEIQQITQLHSQLLSTRPTSGDSTLYLTYEMKNGATVTRKYSLNAQSKVGLSLVTFYSAPGYVLGGETVEELIETVDIIDFYPHVAEYPSISLVNGRDATGKYDRQDTDYRNDLPFAQSQMAKDLLAALLADCAAGNMAQPWDYHPNGELVGSLTLCTITHGYETFYSDVNIYTDCKNTVAFLESLKITPR